MEDEEPVPYWQWTTATEKYHLEEKSKLVYFIDQYEWEKDGEKESNRVHAAESASDKTLAEPQTSYFPCPCILCPCIIGKMYGERCVERQAVIL